jgi:hypothetical protein
MDEVIGARLLGVTRLSWQESGAPVSLASGPTHLVFEDDRAVLITCRSDWSLELVEVTPGTDWRQAFAYDVGGGSWVARDASSESPFDLAVGRALIGWALQLNELGEPVGVAMDFGDVRVALSAWEGEVQAVART